MTLADRCVAFERAFRKWPASHPRLVSEQGRTVLYATWLIGNDYRNKSQLYGAYPRGYLERVAALFPDATAGDTLHVFSGAVPCGPYQRLDLARRFDGSALGFVQGNVYDVAELFSGEQFGLVIADPPYSPADAAEYNTLMVDRRRAVMALAQVTKSGGYLAWLDMCWPMHSKTQWLTVGRILVQRSTNHRVRVLTLFERTATNV